MRTHLLSVTLFSLLLGLAPASACATSTPTPRTCVNPQSPRPVGNTSNKRVHLSPAISCPVPTPKK